VPERSAFSSGAGCYRGSGSEVRRIRVRQVKRGEALSVLAQSATPGVCEVLKLSKEFTPHCFRHAFGTRLGETGADAFTIMKLMGHSTVTVSQRYVHPSPEGIERAMERLAWFGSRAEVPLNAPQYGVGESSENAQVV
jgi:integrase